MQSIFIVLSYGPVSCFLFQINETVDVSFEHAGCELLLRAFVVPTLFNHDVFY